ncbi:MAG: Ig-like domain-containing protein [Candidatus Thermoplasmatota archaeon]|nr:Ig-like domain-containing protein [Candidatus Thermoplasmatota archaeon]
MKTQILKGASILTATLLLSMLMTPVLAGTPLPFERYGNAAGVNNVYITSWIDGVEYGNTTTGATGDYSLTTVGDDTDFPNGVKTGGNDQVVDTIQYARTSLFGATARFFTETDTWSVGGMVNGTLTQEGADTVLLKIDVLASQSTVTGLPDYIIIYNPHTAAVDASTYSLAVGTAAAQPIIAGDIPTGLLVNNSINIPSLGSLVINMAKWGGLSNTANSVKLSIGTHIVDRVEYGAIATEPENTYMSDAVNPPSAQEIYRIGAHQDTNSCLNDFTTRAQSVVLDLVAPTITATTFADGATGVAVAAGIYEATWSEAMAAVGSVTTNLPGATFSWPSTTVYRITYTALAEMTLYTITYNNFTDVALNAAGGDLAKNFTTGDFTAPTITATTFADGATGVAVAAGIYEATWSEAMAAVGSVTTNLPGATFSWPSTTVYRITYTALADMTLYTITYNNFTDVALNAAGGDLAKNFTTGDFTNPTVVPTPADNAVGVAVALATYTLTFSEPMQAVGTLAQDTLPGGTWSWTTTTTYVKTGFTLVASTIYYVNLSAATFLDLAGNPVVQADVAFQFTTTGGAGIIPAQVNDLNATHYGAGSTGILLQWTAKADATSYVIYRTTSLNGTWGWANIAEVTTLNYNDTLAYSDANSYAWVVHSKSAGGENMTKVNSIAHKIAYALSYSATITGGNQNWIALPYAMNLTSGTYHNDAKALKDDITANSGTTCSKVSWWDPTSGYKSYTGIGTPFALVPGRGYMVVTAAAGTYKMVGWYSPASYALAYSATITGGNQNWITVPYHSDLWSGTYNNDAKALKDFVTNNAGTTCSKVSWWDPTSGYKSYTGIGTPFVLVPGRAYMVVTAAAGTIPVMPTTNPGP